MESELPMANFSGSKISLVGLFCCIKHTKIASLISE